MLELKYLLSEDQSQDIAKKKLEMADLGLSYSNLNNLDVTPSKKHLPKLADYYIETKNLNIITSYYKRFIKSKILTYSKLFIILSLLWILLMSV